MVYSRNVKNGSATLPGTTFTVAVATLPLIEKNGGGSAATF